MIFNKKIDGKIVDCNIRREYTLSARNLTRQEELDYCYAYEYDSTCNEECAVGKVYYFDYFFITVEYQISGTKKIITFNDITLRSEYRKNDKVQLNYNRISKNATIANK